MLPRAYKVWGSGFRVKFIRVVRVWNLGLRVEGLTCPA